MDSTTTTPTPATVDPQVTALEVRPKKAGRPRRTAKGKTKGTVLDPAAVAAFEQGLPHVKAKTPARKGKGKAKKLAAKGRPAAKKPGKRPGGKTAAPGGKPDYAARAAKIVAAREANAKAGIGSVRVQRAFAKAMRKAAGL